MGHAKLKAVKAVELLKLDLGCGKSKREGFIGVDTLDFEGVDQVVDLREPWPWKSGSVAEVHCSHFIEHLTALERMHFVNELHRVLTVGGKALVITPYWASNRAYGDLTHQWPPVSEMWFYYLDKGWRAANAPHNESFYTCDFSITWGYGMRPDLQSRNTEYQQYAFQNYKDAILDMIATFVKR